MFLVGREGKIPFLCKQGRRRPFLAQLKLSASHFCATGTDFPEFACYLGAKRGFFRKKVSGVGVFASGWVQKSDFGCRLRQNGIFFGMVAPKWDKPPWLSRGSCHKNPKILQQWGVGIPFFCITPKFHPKSLQDLALVSITRRFLAKIGGILAESCQKCLLLEVETRFFPKKLAPLHKNGKKNWSVAENWDKKLECCRELGFFEVRGASSSNF